MIQGKEGRGYAIDSRYRRSDVDVRTGAGEVFKAWVGGCGKALTVTVDAPTNVVVDWKGVVFGVSEGEGSTKVRSGLDRGPGASAFLRT